MLSFTYSSRWVKPGSFSWYGILYNVEYIWQSGFMSGSLSPSPQRWKSETRRPSETQVVRSRSAVNPASSQEEPIVSKYARTGGSGIREDVLIEELKDLRQQLQEERQKNTRLMGKC